MTTGDSGIFWGSAHYDGPPMPSDYPFGREKVQASYAVPTFGFWSSFRADGAKAYWRPGRAPWPTRRQRRLCQRTGHPETARTSYTHGDWWVTQCRRCRATLAVEPAEPQVVWADDLAGRWPMERWSNSAGPEDHYPLIKHLRYGVHVPVAATPDAPTGLTLHKDQP